MSRSAHRWQVLASLVPAGVSPVVDVGCDHGHLAARLGAIATERTPRSMPDRTELVRVVADGLLPFSHVGCAVIAGMGARTIASILERGPVPDAAVLHAPDDAPWLRRWLATHGFRIETERLAVEGDHIAEIMRVVPGTETASGKALAFGPRLLECGDPLLSRHLHRRLSHWRALLARVEATAPAPVVTEVRDWLTFLERHAL